MQHEEIAKRTGLTLMDLEDLVKGKATDAVAKKLGVSEMDIEDFARGKATDAMTRRLGFKTTDAASELAKAARGGAGILIGYILTMSAAII